MNTPVPRNPSLLMKNQMKQNVMNAAATYIQTTWKEYQLHKMLIRDAAATVIQSMYRGFSTRYTISCLVESLYVEADAAATIIQSRYRGFVARKPIADISTVKLTTTIKPIINIWSSA